YCFFFQAEDGIRDRNVTGVQTCALPICPHLTLDPVHQLLEPKAGEEIDLAAVESVEEILSRLVTRAPLEITDNRAAVDLVSLATAEEVLLTPPAHHDTVGPDGLRVLIDRK